jgi:sulfur carrier protein
MTITVNGQPHETEAGATVAQLLDTLDHVPEGHRGVAVALDDEVVPRGEWHDTVVEAGARVEVLVAIQGG